MSYEVREFGGKVHYQGDSFDDASAVYYKLEHNKTPVTFLRIEVMRESPAFIEARNRLLGAIPWARP